MQLKTLGGLDLVGGDLRRPKPLLLLAYLALEGSKPRRFLADLFFPGAVDPSDALSTTLRRLRPVGATVEQGDDVVCVVPCDAKELLTGLDTGAVESALPLYGGPFLGSVRVPLEPELEEWVFGTREFIAQRVRQVVLRAAEAAAASGEQERAWRLAADAYALAGAPEPSHDDLRRLLRVLANSESNVAAMVRDDARQLGLDVEHVERPVKAERVRSAAVSLPEPPTSLVGRDEELIELSRLLALGSCRLLTIHGPAGAGKTRLAIQAAADQVRSLTFEDGIYFVSTEELTDADQIPTALLPVMGAGPGGSEGGGWHDLADAIGSRDMLVVLDSLEHLVGAASDLRLLLQRCGRLKLLVTSRSRLGIAEEWVLSIAGLRVPAGDLGWEDARLTEAVQLFERRAQSANVTFQLMPDHLSHVVRICLAVEGLPLGIELAAAWTRVLGLEELATSFESDLSAIGKHRLDVGSRHPSLWAAFEHSWELLHADARRALTKLCVFRGGFRREAASVVAGTSIPLLMELVDASFIRMGATGRYSQHALSKHFVTEKLREDGEVATAAGLSHALYYSSLLKRASGGSDVADLHAAFRVLQEEEANILACLTWAAGHARTDILVELAEPLLWYFPMTGRFRYGGEVFMKAVSALDEKDDRQHEAIASLTLGRAWLARYAGSLDEARALAADGERFARSAGSQLQIVRALDLRGQALTYEGDLQEARSLLAEGVSIAIELGDDLRLSRIRTNLGLAEALGGASDVAAHQLGEAMAPFEEGRLPIGLDTVATLLASGVARWCAGDYQASADVFRRAVSLAESLEYLGPVPVLKALLAASVLEVAQAEADASPLEEVRILVDDALKMVEQSREGMATSLLHGVASALALGEGDLELAIAEARESYLVARHIGNVLIMVWSLPRLLDAYVARGDVALAMELARHLQDHPATPAWSRDYARRIASALAGGGSESLHPANPSYVRTLDEVVGVGRQAKEPQSGR